MSTLNMGLLNSVISMGKFRLQIRNLRIFLLLIKQTCVFFVPKPVCSRVDVGGNVTDAALIPLCHTCTVAPSHRWCLGLPGAVGPATAGGNALVGTLEATRGVGPDSINSSNTTLTDGAECRG